MPDAVGESDDDLFEELDDQTALQVLLPAQEPCAFPTSGDDSSSCVGCSSDDAAATGGSADSGGQGGESPVTVYAHDFTENFEFHVVGAEETQELVDWLQREGYNVSDNMTPVMDIYNGTETVFLALKLQAGREASDIQPLEVTYATGSPSIPIQLTAVAAQPLMGILVWIVADVPYASANYIAAAPDTADILHDEQGITNYFQWVARRADEAAGQFFSIEYVGPATFRGQSRTVSRLYTRMSAHRMTVDPVFSPHTNSSFFQSNLLDLTANRTMYACGQVLTERLPNDCAFNYCGDDAQCTVSGGQVGCLCADEDVAQTVTGPDGGTRVTCIPEENPYGVVAVDAGAGTEFDPCASVGCGTGTCVLRGGFPTCQCNEGTIAVVSGTGSNVVCTEADGEITTFGPGAGLESQPTVVTYRVPARKTSTRYAAVWLPALLVLLGLGVIRLRRSRDC